MKNIEFTSLRLENFGKHESLESKLGRRVYVKGANMTGKSTVKRAIQYILGSKDENGKEITGIRPHDENGVDIDGLTTTAELTVSVDGQENTLKRTCFQEKNRQGEYTGRDNLQYFIDDVKKGTKKAYDEFVSSFLPSMVCISAQEFLSKDTAGRRAMLEVFSEHDTDSIIDENAKFEPIRAKLKANSVADLKKACRDKIKKQEKERDGYPVRIDEIIKQMVDIDVAELELQRNALKEQIAENKAKQEDISKQYAEYDEWSKDILDLQFELNGLQQQANEELENKRRKLRSKADNLYQENKDLARQIGLNDRDIGILEDYIRKHTEEIEKCREDWNRINSEEMSKDSVICPTCHREMPEDFKENYVAQFEKSKKDRLDLVTQKGNDMKNRIEQDKSEIEQIKATRAENEKRKSDNEEVISVLERKLNELPQSIDISDREDVKAIKQQIAEKEQAMKKANSGAEIRQQLQEESTDLQAQLMGVDAQIYAAQKNAKIDERVAELQKEQRDLSQKIADIERELDLLKQFERRKAELLETDVNKNFEFVQFRMFEQMVSSDELRDVCQILVSGESYDRNLNFSNRLLAEVDICRGFQKKFDVQLPILLDNAESIDKDRLPNIPNQLILFQRADSKELKIETIK